jgi:hypothetical protein
MFEMTHCSVVVVLDNALNDGHLPAKMEEDVDDDYDNDHDHDHDHDDEDSDDNGDDHV